jgi:hypothetical protein
VATSFNKKNDFNWTRHVPYIVRQFNSRKVPGTNFTRNSVDKHNYLQVLSQQHGIEDPDVLMTTGTSSSYSDRAKKALWKYSKGQRVLLLRASNYQIGQKKLSFEKPSVRGRFGPRAYYVTKLVMKRDRKMALVPVYELSEEAAGGKPLSGYYYENEVKPFPA